MTDQALLRRIDGYLDAAPRSAVRTETLGPFTLFILEHAAGWRYYARPTPGCDVFTPDEVLAVRERQRELDQPESFEWVDDLASGLGPAAEAAGMRVSRMPLLCARAGRLRSIDPPPDTEIVFAAARDDIAMTTAVAMVSFGHPATRSADQADDPLEVAQQLDPDGTEFNRRRIQDGYTVLAMARIEGTIVAVGSHQPVADVTEIVGVATLPAYRRRGIGAAITSALAREAQQRGIELICLSAGDDDSARVYERAGFERVGHVGEAAPA